MSEEKDFSITTEEYVNIPGDEFLIKFAEKLDPKIREELNKQLKALIIEKFPHRTEQRIQFPIRGWVGMIVSPTRDIKFQIPSGADIRFRLR